MVRMYAVSGHGYAAQAGAPDERSPRSAANARAGRLVIDDDATSFVHVDDAAAAAVQALTWPSGPVNICDDEPAAGRQWVPAFCQAVGAPAPAGTSPALASRGHAELTTAVPEPDWRGRRVTRHGKRDFA